MLVLFETPAGYAVFKLLKEKKLQKTENLYLDFENADEASKIVKLRHFQKFKDMTEALSAATAAVEGKMSKTLKKMMKKLVATDAQEQLLVADAKLGNVIKDKFDMQCLSNSNVQELMRCIRSQMDSLITGLPQKEMAAMALGLAHSLSRYKLKFSPDKVDTMIVQAISLLDDLDKELNNYIMRCREWYGWHFPELGKIVQDNLAYAKLVKKMGERVNAVACDLSAILPEEVEQELKEAAEISMGTEISEEDLLNIQYLCDQIIDISDYRAQLYDYLKNRMIAIAPNLTILVGELVGARLIAHAGSLLNLAKHPASTVQIIGSEKALFRALKTKHDTPKYGLIYHASLVGSASAKFKGKMSRMLAAKASLAIRVDALGDETNTEIGLEHRAKLERAMKMLEEQGSRRIIGTGKMKAKWEKYDNRSEIKTYNPAADSTLPRVTKKRKLDQDDDDEEPVKKEPKMEPGEESPSKLKHKMKQVEESEETPKKKKKKKKHLDASGDASILDTTQESLGSPNGDISQKKKKKKKKVKQEAESD
ncbi:nucleolar protein 58-like [Gigantopelta aegis]|uniref:nucleolar protein 58-like n=1 Tax=Gigantopelta aegis TaxID=1735272 RepID=UPI001B88B643|nr:nucleolar protein 58-like [Gigantopelta aegis]